MKTSTWILIALVAALVAVAASSWLMRERYQTPADEARLIAPICRKIIDQQQRYYRQTGRYVSLQQLKSAGTGSTSLGEGLPAHWHMEVQASADGFVCRITPAKSANGEIVRRLALYADESGVIRARYGRGEAGPEDKALPDRY